MSTFIKRLCCYLKIEITPKTNNVKRSISPPLLNNNNIANVPLIPDVFGWAQQPTVKNISNVKIERSSTYKYNYPTFLETITKSNVGNDFSCQAKSESITGEEQTVCGSFNLKNDISNIHIFGIVSRGAGKRFAILKLTKAFKNIHDEQTTLFRGISNKLPVDTNREKDGNSSTDGAMASETSKNTCTVCNKILYILPVKKQGTLRFNDLQTESSKYFSSLDATVRPGMVFSPKLVKESIGGCAYIHFINENIWFMKRMTYFHVISRNESLVRNHNESVITPSSICSWNNSQLRGNASQVPTQPFTSHADSESVLMPQVGWAGQPTVKRIHPILPEVYGDVSDIFSLMKAETLSGKTNEHLFSTEMKSVEINSGEDRSCAQREILYLQPAEELKNRDMSHDTVPIINNNTKDVLKKSILEVNKPRLLKKHKNPINSENILFKSGVIMKSKKKKIKKKKKTKVLESKSTNDSKIKKKKKISQDFGIRNNSKMYTNLVFNQRINTQSSPQNGLLMEIGQHKTGLALNYSKMAVNVNVKEKETKKTARKTNLDQKKNSQNHTKEGIYADDCICPESLIDKGKRKSTNICGEASGNENKEIKKWQPKMCLVERKIKHRRKTFVCHNKFKNDKRKRQLPKCPKLEKKQAPRSVICLPKIDDIKERKAKKCEKQVEEIKIRKRTKVCKPVIIYGKEVAEIKIVQSLCTETKLGKKMSRHTQICSPTNKTKQEKANQ